MTTVNPTQSTPQPTTAPALHLAHSTRPAIPRDRLLRLPDVEAITGLRKSSVYALMRAGKFPKNVVVTRRLSAWSESSILLWVQARINTGAVQ